MGASNKEVVQLKTKAIFFKGVIILFATIISFLTFLIGIEVFTSGETSKSFTIPLFFTSILLTDLFAFSALFYLYQMVSLIGNEQAFSNQILPLAKKLNQRMVGMAVTFCGILPFVYRVAELDDAPGLIIVGLMIVSIPFSLVVFGKIVEELFKQAVYLKRDQDLTI